MKFTSGVGVLKFWYEYAQHAWEYVIPSVFISEDDEGKAPFIAPESFDYPDWWYTWHDTDLIVRKLTRPDWALIAEYFRNIYNHEAGTFYRWANKERFKELCNRVYLLLGAEYKKDHVVYTAWERVFTRLMNRAAKGEIEVGKIDPAGIYTVKEVADILRYDDLETLRQMLREGKLKGGRAGKGDWRILGQAILDLLGMGDKNDI